MKFNKDQVLAVLKEQDRPLTTAEVLQECRDSVDLPRYGGGTGHNVNNVRPALDELVVDGLVVSAKYVASYDHKPGHGDGPYQFMAQRGDSRSFYWMAKERADEYKVKLDRAEELHNEYGAKAKKLAELLPGSVRYEIGVEPHAGAVFVRLDGSGDTLDALLAAMQKLHGVS